MKAINEALKLYAPYMSAHERNRLSGIIGDMVTEELLSDFCLLHIDSSKCIDMNHESADYQVRDYGELHGKGYSTLDGALKSARS